jgi:2'-5' RNA ligase
MKTPQLLTIIKEAAKGDSYGCAMLYFEDADSNCLKNWNADMKAIEIPDEDLHEYGREDEPHVTVLYGLHTGSAAKVKKALADNERTVMTVRMGGLDIFENDDFDVLIRKVERTDHLTEVRKHLIDKLETTITFKDYKPHATVAYLKKGKGKEYLKKYKDLDWKLNGEFDCGTIDFSDKGTNHTKIDLTAVKAASIDVDIEVGDTVLTGRFKNKKTVVKEIGTDSNGQPTINGMKLLAMRIDKLMPAKAEKKAGEESAPNYKQATDPATKCSACSHAEAGYCTLYDFAFNAKFTCDSFATDMQALTDEGVPQVVEKYLPKTAQYVNPYLKDIEMEHLKKPLPDSLTKLVAWLVSRNDANRKINTYYGAMDNMKQAQVLPTGPATNNTLPGSATAPTGGIVAPMNNSVPSMNAGGAGVVSPNLKNSFQNIAQTGVRNSAAAKSKGQLPDAPKAKEQLSEVASDLNQSNTDTPESEAGTPASSGVADNGSLSYGVNAQASPYGVNAATAPAAPTGPDTKAASFAHGFVAKCHEYGVDPEELLDKSAQLEFGKPGTPGYQHSYQPQGAFEMEPGKSVWSPQQRKDIQRGQFTSAALKNVARSMFSNQYGNIPTSQTQMINFTEGKA